MEEIKAQKFVCGGCKAVSIVEMGADVPLGYHGTVMEHGTEGGNAADFYACRKQCIRPAILGALEDAHEDGRAGGIYTEMHEDGA